MFFSFLLLIYDHLKIMKLIMVKLYKHSPNNET